VCLWPQALPPGPCGVIRNSEREQDEEEEDCAHDDTMVLARPGSMKATSAVKPVQTRRMIQIMTDPHTAVLAFV